MIPMLLFAIYLVALLLTAVVAKLDNIYDQLTQIRSSLSELVLHSRDERTSRDEVRS